MSAAGLFDADSEPDWVLINFTDDDAIRCQYIEVLIPDAGEFHIWHDSPLDVGHPVNLLAAIERDPRVAEAVECVVFYPLDDEEMDKGVPQNRHPDFLPDFNGTAGDREVLRALKVEPLSRIKFLGFAADDDDGQEWEKWAAAIARGNSSATFAVLLTMLPNLRVLKLSDGGREYKRWLDKVFRYAGSIHNSTTEILTNLELVETTYADTEMGENPDILDEVVLIPSLRTLNIHQLEDEDGTYQCLMTKRDDKTMVSNVNVVDLMWCNVNWNVLAEFIKPLTKLEKLDFEHQHPFNIYTEDFGKEFSRVAGRMLKQRGLVWKSGRVGNSMAGLRIRTKDREREVRGLGGFGSEDLDDDGNVPDRDESDLDEEEEEKGEKDDE